MKFAAGVLTAMAAVFCTIFFWPLSGASIGGASPMPSATEASGPSDTFGCSVASITDGDTFRCHEIGADGKQVRIRLSGVAARERDGSCTEGHPCPTASADEAAQELSRLAMGKQLRCRSMGTTYNRVAAFCSLPDGSDLSCSMVASGTVERWDKYWKGGPTC
jgi:endonuclease YncB( thermonuclease family)